MLRTIPSQFLFELGIEFAESENVVEEEAGNHCSEDSFRKGELVRHKFFGLGRVEKFVDMGENSVVVINFENGQIKSLMVKYAKLSKINPPSV